MKKVTTLAKLYELGGCDAEPDTWADGYDKAIDLVYDFVRGMPTAEVEPVRHGRWIFDYQFFDGGFTDIYRCSECGSKNGNTDYCPNCGAKMDGRC